MSTRIKSKKEVGSTSLQLDYIRVMKFDHVKSSQLLIQQRWREHAETLVPAFYEVPGLL
jgi:hypothetical protein